VLIYYLRLSGYSAAILREQAINTIIEYRKTKTIVKTEDIPELLDKAFAELDAMAEEDEVTFVVDMPAITIDEVQAYRTEEHIPSQDILEPTGHLNPELPIHDKVLHDPEPEVFVGVDFGKTEDEVVVVSVQDDKVLPNEPIGWFPPELRDKPVEESELTVPEVDPFYDVANLPDHKEDLAGWCAGVSKLLEMGAVKHRLAEELGISTTTLNNRLKKNAKTS